MRMALMLAFRAVGMDFQKRNTAAVETTLRAGYIHTGRPCQTRWTRPVPCSGLVRSIV